MEILEGTLENFLTIILKLVNVGRQTWISAGNEI